MIVLKLSAGLLILIAGAEILVKGASKIAAAAGISPLVIGLTVVAFGTSSPELAVSFISSLNGIPDIALGNVVGSNIFNVLFILGISSLIIPLAVARQLIKLDVPIMIGASLAMLAFAWDGIIKPREGVVLLTAGIVYTVFIIRLSKKEKGGQVLEQGQYDKGIRPQSGKSWLSIFFIFGGLGLLLWGSRWLVDGAVVVARSLGISDLVVGLTIIAAGTSLPEVATSVIASLRGERDIAVGNVVGSCIFNIFFILSVSAIAGGGISVGTSATEFDIPVMIAVAIACLPIFFTGKKIDRWEGFVFLSYYVAYTVYIILASLKRHVLATFSDAMIWFVIPITLLTLGIVATREIRLRGKNN